ncbi:MAG: hypothetical protein KGO52_03665 [Nitrospirota bacterium]|nr:hypothetical protein [Nitrospirota bacterium]MDE3118458.1 hypothetical protein [Nitrospirota bacterium]MDE3226178.1 hypothetical protein [Nitrospirota bacterium]MDE3241803.1 hypothetical protein [Nitrospirota bacterium]
MAIRDPRKVPFRLASAGDLPFRTLLDQALQDFRQALTDRGLYKRGHQNLDRAVNGARDFVDSLFEGPWVLEKGRRRIK